MSMQEVISDRRQLVTTVVLVVLVVAGALLYWRWSRANVPNPAGDRAWFTVDDGKTWFAESADKISPFEQEGKLAYRCYVYTCEAGGETFVSHVERHPPDARKRLGEAGVPFDPMAISVIEVKDPLTGDRNWTPQTDPKANEITAPRCPNHPDRMGQPVLP